MYLSTKNGTESILEKKESLSLGIWKWLETLIFCLIEPNLLSGTAHSVNKRGVKRRDLDIEELREILSPLLPFVRIEHILPINSEVLGDAVSLSSFIPFMKRKCTKNVRTYLCLSL